jgi:thioredoxin-dependent peroxiredoxin
LKREPDCDWQNFAEVQACVKHWPDDRPGILRRQADGGSLFLSQGRPPGCTKEACGFRDALPQYDKSKIAVLGISPDKIEAVNRFARKYSLNFPLLADADHSVAEKYGVWQEKRMYGRKYWGVARTTFVIGKDGKVMHVFEKVKPAGHEKEILDWIAAANG